MDTGPPSQTDFLVLKTLIDEASQLKSLHKTRAPNREPNEAGEWQCGGCRRFLPVQFFCANTRSPRIPVAFYCRDCDVQRARAYYRTLRGNVKRLSAAARYRSNRRNQVCTLTIHDIFCMLWNQKGRCSYSGVAMEILIPNSHWRMSLERKDNNCGYTPGNCVLIAAEFNTSDFSRYAGVVLEHVTGTAQWSACKVHSVSGMRSRNVDLGLLTEDIQQARSKSFRGGRSRTRVREPNALGEFQCCKCKAYKSLPDFSRHPTSSCGIQSYCRACQKHIRCNHRRTLRGLVQQMLSGARQSSLSRQQVYALEPDHILVKLWLQGGRCFYSGVLLEYQDYHTDWQMSLERLDNSIGYTWENCVLIVLEFQTADNSRNKAKTEVFGTAQWSRAKVAHVWGESSGEEVLRAVQPYDCQGEFSPKGFM
ncbi:unnamed protein product [Polarella glacialis]|uniref:Uncharacterized protein n=1 Tax=Polarella glacialis TaxID=89957 RepID=A0A813EPE7_POLGL|nr:unnamed protein product [Polarella glacialis]